MAQALAHVTSQITHRLIAVENVQRDIFLAPRELRDIHFCVPWSWFPEELRENAFQNPGQQEEWRDLYNLTCNTPSEVPPHTLIDTRHFDQSFLTTLMAFTGIDLSNQTGLAICGDNFHALNLLRESYSEQVKVIYIDPPYNTGNREFLYRDEYHAQTWGILMENVLRLARELLRKDGLIFVSIDDNLVHDLVLLLKQVFGPDAHIATMPVKSNPRGRSMERLIATTHEYLLLFAKNSQVVQLTNNALTGDQVSEYNKIDPALGPYRLLELRNRNPEFHRLNRPNLHYPIFFYPVSGELSLLEVPGWEKILPKTSQGKDAVWRWSKEKFLANQDRIVIKRVKRAQNPFNVYKKDFLYEINGEMRKSKHKTFLDDNSFNYQNGKRVVRDMFGEALFGNPKPLALIEKCLSMAINTGDELVLDFFAGSGTTGRCSHRPNATGRVTNPLHFSRDCAKYSMTPSCPA